MNKISICTSLLMGILLSIVPINNCQGQDLIFSQYYQAMSALNPAFAGQNSGPNFGVFYRNQWPSLADGVYESYLFTYNQFFSNLNSGFGVQFTSDDQGSGILRNNSFHIDYAYRVRTRSDWRINMGINVGAEFRSLDWNQLVFYDQLDPEFGAVLPGNIEIPTEEDPPTSLNRVTMDLGTGISVYNNQFYFGMSVLHLNRPNVSFLNINSNSRSGIPMRYNIMTGVQIPFGRDKKNPKSFITPSVLASFQGASGQIMAGTYIGLGNFFTNLYYRHALSNPDAVILGAGVKINFFKLGYSYDFTVSKLRPNTGGTHEIALSVNIVREKEKYLDCFNFIR